MYWEGLPVFRPDTVQELLAVVQGCLERDSSCQHQFTFLVFDMLDSHSVIKELLHRPRPETIVVFGQPQLRGMIIDEPILLQQGIVVNLDFDRGLASGQVLGLGPICEREQSARQV